MIDQPILDDNRNARKEIPEIEEYFKKAMEEVSDLPMENGIVVDEKYGRQRRLFYLWLF